MEHADPESEVKEAESEEEDVEYKLEALHWLPTLSPLSVYMLIY